MSIGGKILLSYRAVFQRALLAWYRMNARDLPWRSEPSLYKTVVSEFMLQQTQVKTALPYFARWMETLPDFKTLAKADENSVLKLWEGLGYYSRARNLHKVARALAALKVLPITRAEWLELPGIGPYTAAAITSMAFGAREACVDGNVVRILARLSGDETTFRDSASAAKYFTSIAEELLSADNPGDHNQAMMELGALVCSRQAPACSVCPVRAWCAAGAQGGVAIQELPRFEKRSTEAQEVTRLWLVDEAAACARGAVLVHCSGRGARRLAGLCELPSLAQIGLTPEKLKKWRRKFPDKTLAATQARSITRFRIVEKIHAVSLARDAKVREGEAPLRKFVAAAVRNSSGALRWLPLGDLDSVAFSGPHRRLVKRLSRAAGV